MASPPTVETRRVYRRRTALLSLLWGWTAGIVVWAGIFSWSVIRLLLDPDRPARLSEAFYVGAVMTLIFGAFQLFFMLPGALAFWLWHRRLAASALGIAAEGGIGALVGAAAMGFWGLVFVKSNSEPFASLAEGPETWAAMFVGAATFVAGARYRRREDEHLLQDVHAPRRRAHSDGADVTETSA